jgi:hypothetical protein
MRATNTSAAVRFYFLVSLSAILMGSLDQFTAECQGADVAALSSTQVPGISPAQVTFSGRLGLFSLPLGSTGRDATVSSFQLTDLTTPSIERNPEGVVWGGAILGIGLAATAYGFLERGTYYSSKDVVRTIREGDSVSVLRFTLYDKRHANPHTALLTSFGLFCNGSYWMLKDKIEGVDLEEYSDYFSEKNMGLYSMVIGAFVTASAFLVPEYTDKIRRGYETTTEPNGRVQYFPIQEESRDLSYRQFAVNVGSGAIYLGFGLWQFLLKDYFFPPEETTAVLNSPHRAKANISFVPMADPPGGYLICRF